MSRILDRIILLIYCLGAVLLQEADTAFLAAFLSAVIYSFLGYYFRQRSLHIILAAFYISFAIFFPTFLLFFPVILYGFAEDKLFLSLILVVEFCLFHFHHAPWRLLPFLILGSAITLWLDHQTSLYEMLDAEFKKMRDDSVERNLLLKQKNQSLLEKQNYEIYNAVLKERNRIAREIHDNTGHMLSRSILLTGAAKAINKEEGLTPLLSQLEETLNTAMTDIRKSVHDLHDESVNLKETLDNLIESFSFCPAVMEYDMGFQIPQAVRYGFIAIIREALNNVIKHSNADRVHILVREHPALYQLIIEDNGTDIKTTKLTDGTGMGLTNIKDRVDSLDGNLQIQIENGFRIFITIPKKEAL